MTQTKEKKGLEFLASYFLLYIVIERIVILSKVNLGKGCRARGERSFFF